MSQKNAVKNQMENEGKTKISDSQSSNSGNTQKTGQHHNAKDQKGKQDPGNGSGSVGKKQNSRDN